jgi:hypothetical protein
MFFATLENVPRPCFIHTALHTYNIPNPIYLKQMESLFRKSLDVVEDIEEIIQTVHPYFLLYTINELHKVNTFYNKNPFRQLRNKFCEDFYCLKEIHQKYLNLQPFLLVNNSSPSYKFGNWRECTDLKKLDKKKDTPYFDFNVDCLDDLMFFTFLHTIIAILSVAIDKCVFKIKNIVHPRMMQCIYLINSMFQNVDIIKPSISNWLSDSCFLVCRKRHEPDLELLNFLKLHIETMPSQLDLSLTIPLTFLYQLEAISVHIQKENLHKYNQINHFIKYKKHQKSEEEIVETCLKWCRSNGIKIANEIQEKYSWKRNTSPPTGCHSFSFVAEGV